MYFYSQFAVCGSVMAKVFIIQKVQLIIRFNIHEYFSKSGVCAVS